MTRICAAKYSRLTTLLHLLHLFRGQPNSGLISRSSNNEYESLCNWKSFIGASSIGETRHSYQCICCLLFCHLKHMKVPQCLLLSLVEHNFIAQHGNREDDHRMGAQCTARTTCPWVTWYFAAWGVRSSKPPSGSGPDGVVCRAVDIVFNTTAFAEETPRETPVRPPTARH